MMRRADVMIVVEYLFLFLFLLCVSTAHGGTGHDVVSYSSTGTGEDVVNVHRGDGTDGTIGDDDVTVNDNILVNDSVIHRGGDIRGRDGHGHDGNVRDIRGDDVIGYNIAGEDGDDDIDYLFPQRHDEIEERQSKYEDFPNWLVTHRAFLDSSAPAGAMRNLIFNVRYAEGVLNTFFGVLPTSAKSLLGLQEAAAFHYPGFQSGPDSGEFPIYSTPNTAVMSAGTRRRSREQFRARIESIFSRNSTKSIIKSLARLAVQKDKSPHLEPKSGLRKCLNDIDKLSDNAAGNDAKPISFPISVNFKTFFATVVSVTGKISNLTEFSSAEVASKASPSVRARAESARAKSARTNSMAIHLALRLYGYLQLSQKIYLPIRAFIRYLFEVLLTEKLSPQLTGDIDVESDSSHEFDDKRGNGSRSDDGLTKAKRSITFLQVLVLLSRMQAIVAEGVLCNAKERKDSLREFIVDSIVEARDDSHEDSNYARSAASSTSNSAANRTAIMKTRMETSSLDEDISVASRTPRLRDEDSSAASRAPSSGDEVVESSDILLNFALVFGLDFILTRLRAVVFMFSSSLAFYDSLQMSIPTLLVVQRHKVGTVLDFNHYPSEQKSSSSQHYFGNHYNYWRESGSTGTLAGTEARSTSSIRWRVSNAASRSANPNSIQSLVQTLGEAEALPGVMERIVESEANKMPNTASEMVQQLLLGPVTGLGHQDLASGDLGPSPKSVSTVLTLIRYQVIHVIDSFGLGHNASGRLTGRIDSRNKGTTGAPNADLTKGANGIEYTMSGDMLGRIQLLRWILLYLYYMDSDLLSFESSARVRARKRVSISGMTAMSKRLSGSEKLSKKPSESLNGLFKSLKALVESVAPSSKCCCCDCGAIDGSM